MTMQQLSQQTGMPVSELRKAVRYLRSKHMLNRRTFIDRLEREFERKVAR